MINPKVYAEAELFTDSKITPDVLERVAARMGLPLHVQDTAPSASVADLAAEIRSAQYLVASCRKAFVAACKRLGAANRRWTVVEPMMRRYVKPQPIPLAAVRFEQRLAMAQLNQARRTLKMAEKALAIWERH